jgi:predicted RNase H-like HicB family nuclease
MINSQYLTIIQQDENGKYNVSFPDFPGCVTCGETYEEARENAVEALSLWIEETGQKTNNVSSSNLLMPTITFTTPYFA